MLKKLASEKEVPGVGGPKDAAHGSVGSLCDCSDQYTAGARIIDNILWRSC